MCSGKLLQKQPYMPFLSLLSVLATLICVTKSQITDSYTSYYSGDATAMDIQFSDSTVVFANANMQIVRYSLYPIVLLKTISTAHKTQISSIAISPDRTAILTGGSDFTARVYNYTTSTLMCTFQELRGKIISTKIASDNDFIAFGSNEGFLYYGYITNCSVSYISKLDYELKGIQIITARSEIWVADGASTVMVVNMLTGAITLNITVASGKAKSVMHMSTNSYVGVCTSRAFYLMNYTGTVFYTLTNPTVHTQKCRAAASATSGDYFLTAIPQAKSYLISSTYYYPLWSIWQISTGSLTGYLQTQKVYSDTRYSSTSTILDDAAVFVLDNQYIRVVSIADGYNPYHNYYYATATVSWWTYSCPTGFYLSLLLCYRCGYDVSTMSFCSACSSSSVCSACMVKTYFVSGTKTCAACPTNCHTCTSASVCTSCAGGYTLISSACVWSNITGCTNAFLDSPMSRCKQCEFEYLAQDDLYCKTCDNVHPNCSTCTSSLCVECMPNFVMMSATSGSCQLCSMAIQGCAACLNQSYCDTCYISYPYFYSASTTSRICVRYCDIVCLTCSHADYTVCLTCPTNRTLSGSTCVCDSGYPIEDTSTGLCQACIDFISECDTCSSQTYCTACLSGYYLYYISSTYQQCLVCNYTCASCTTYYQICTTCDASLYRVLNTSTNRCECLNISYFQLASPTVECGYCPTYISDCLVCFNSTYCRTCASGYFVYTVSTGINSCVACTTPCVQCYGSATNCTECATGRYLSTGSTINTCECYDGYYASGTVSCSACSPLLGACLQCDNATTCTSCWQNNYYVIVGTLTKCQMCQSTCLTCSVYTTICATCDTLAHRVLNTSTSQCDCMIGYIQSSGKCMNCSGMFTYCTSCNASVCFTCDTGYSLAYGGLKCIDCAQTYPGCTLCVNGVCAACNASAGYQLAYSKCICRPGYYESDDQCLAYKMGSSIQRQFVGYGSYHQDMNTSVVTITVVWRCQYIKVPAGISSCSQLTLNGDTIDSYSISKSNTIFTIKFTPTQSYSKAQIILTFKNQTLYDYDEYGPKNRVFTFTKNVYTDTQYDLSSQFVFYYEKYIQTWVRYLITVSLLLGCADLSLILVFSTHVIPAFLLLGLSVPMPLQEVLEAMVKINFKNIFIFSDFMDTTYDYYDTQGEYTQGYQYGAEGGLIYNKSTDLLVMACLLFLYGWLLPMLTEKVPQGIRRIWQFKFMYKRYSTIGSIIFTFLPTFLTCAVLDLQFQKIDPSALYGMGLSVVVLCFSGISLFAHSIILKQTQFDSTYKNEDSYFGASVMEPRSVYFVMSLLVIGMWSIPLMGLIQGIICLPIIALYIIWHIAQFRFWSNFPNKVLYFLRIAHSVLFLLFVAAYLLFEVSQKYQAVGVYTLKFIGLCTLVNIIIILGLSVAQTVFLSGLTVYRVCKHGRAVVENEQFNTKDKGVSQDVETNQESEYNRKMRLTASRKDMYDPKLTNKQKHMQKFKSERQQRGPISKMQITNRSFRETELDDPSILSSNNTKYKTFKYFEQGSRNDIKSNKSFGIQPMMVTGYSNSFDKTMKGGRISGMSGIQ